MSSKLTLHITQSMSSAPAEWQSFIKFLRIKYNRPRLGFDEDEINQELAQFNAKCYNLHTRESPFIEFKYETGYSLFILKFSGECNE